MDHGCRDPASPRSYRHRAAEVCKHMGSGGLLVGQSLHWCEDAALVSSPGAVRVTDPRPPGLGSVVVHTDASGRRLLCRSPRAQWLFEGPGPLGCPLTSKDLYETKNHQNTSGRSTREQPTVPEEHVVSHLVWKCCEASSVECDVQNASLSW
ncbi:hypothetical protein NHX12_018562 [Muraenolepis orangiensis]|uniref:Uncharacterized protein n=1 Tax=Muraenolepis orangiensis TaxID=630683 RepID=A0A9Q0EYE3_9TELE|nr:hypothetical protein NHX12_018562 [Muraenolepis orangiensis]